jgi:hypothetical protein
MTRSLKVSLEDEIKSVSSEIAQTKDVLQRLQLVQERINLQAQLGKQADRTSA